MAASRLGLLKQPSYAQILQDAILISEDQDTTGEELPVIDCFRVSRIKVNNRLYTSRDAEKEQILCEVRSDVSNARRYHIEYSAESQLPRSEIPAFCSRQRVLYSRSVRSHGRAMAAEYGARRTSKDKPSAGDISAQEFRPIAFWRTRGMDRIKFYDPALSKFFTTREIAARQAQALVEPTVDTVALADEEWDDLLKNFNQESSRALDDATRERRESVDQGEQEHVDTPLL